jgi:hypothetical protein
MNFWPSCGFIQLRRNARGWLTPTADYFALLLNRPEMALVPESCKAEIRLHKALQAAPLKAVLATELEQIKDADARHNYQVFLSFRDGLIASGTLEGYYRSLFAQTAINTPPVFIDLLVQAILRNMLDDCTDAQDVRAAELLFRPQRIAIQDGQVLAADRDAVDHYSETAGLGELGRLLLESKASLRTANFKVLSSSNADRYWSAPERHPFLLDLTHEIAQELSHGLTLRMARARSGLQALARVLEKWVWHFCAVQVHIQPEASVEDTAWRWHTGLDAESSAILNRLYEGQAVETDQMQRLISLFRLTFTNPQDVQPELANKPVYLGLAMNAEKVLRIKPQNLLLNLPLASP